LVYCDPKSWLKDPERLNLPEGWVIAVGVHPPSQEFLDPCTAVQSKPPERPVQMHMGIHSIRNQDRRLPPNLTVLFPTPSSH
jgi:hypothetical protein